MGINHGNAAMLRTARVQFEASQPSMVFTALYSLIECLSIIKKLLNYLERPETEHSDEQNKDQDGNKDVSRVQRLYTPVLLCVINS